VILSICVSTSKGRSERGRGRGVSETESERDELGWKRREGIGVRREHRGKETDGSVSIEQKKSIEQIGRS
jgi:hypothetical protein